MDASGVLKHRGAVRGHGAYMLIERPARGLYISMLIDEPARGLYISMPAMSPRGDGHDKLLLGPPCVWFYSDCKAAMYALSSSLTSAHAITLISL